MEYLCDIEWSRIYFQICLFFTFKYFKIAWAYRALPPPRNPNRSFNFRSYQETYSASRVPFVLRMHFALPKFWFFPIPLELHLHEFLVSTMDPSVCDSCINYPHKLKLGRKDYAIGKLNFAEEKTRLSFHVNKHWIEWLAFIKLLNCLSLLSCNSSHAD